MEKAQVLDRPQRAESPAASPVRLSPPASLLKADAEFAAMRLFEYLEPPIPDEFDDDVECDMESISFVRNHSRVNTTGQALGGAVADEAPGSWSILSRSRSYGLEYFTEMIATATPGSELGLLLAQIEPDALSDYELVDYAAACQRQESWLYARKLNAVAELSQRQSMHPRWPDSAGNVAEPSVTVEELAMRLPCSRGAARQLVADAAAGFAGPLSGTGKALEAGKISVPNARVIFAQLREAAYQIAELVEERVLPGAERRTPTQLRRDIERASIAVDPIDYADRRKIAHTRRRVDRPRPMADGLASWHAVLPAPDAVVMDTVLDHHARAMRHGGDSRTLDQLRADLLVAAILEPGSVSCKVTSDEGVPGGGLSSECVPDSGEDGSVSDADGSPVGTAGADGTDGAQVRRVILDKANPTKTPVRAQINVTVPLSTLLSMDEQPGDVTGFGPIDAITARALAAGGTWRRIVTDPLSGAVLDVGRTRYRPPAALADHVRIRDKQCIRPGCSTPAQSADLDHTEEFHRHGGDTSAANLGPLCHRDHQIKTDGGHQLRQITPGVYEWTTPTGHRYAIEPGRDAFHAHLPSDTEGRIRPALPPENGSSIRGRFGRSGGRSRGACRKAFTHARFVRRPAVLATRRRSSCTSCTSCTSCALPPCRTPLHPSDPTEYAYGCILMHMSFSVAVAGASGYAGGEFLRLATMHPELDIRTLTAHSSAGTTLGVHHPHIRSLADRVIEPTTTEALSGHDVVVLALPHGASGPIADSLPQDTIVIDLGADHRLVDPAAWESFYGSAHAGTWPYGLPELATDRGDERQRVNLRGVKRIAVPGCNVTAVTLGIQPGVVSEIADTKDLVAVLAVGYSGAGKALKSHLLASEALSNAAPYAVAGTHRHIPEIQQNLVSAGAEAVRISFTPVLVPMSRGILATTTAPLASGTDSLTDNDIHAIWVDFYRDERFVQVLPQGQWPSTAMVQGSNTALVQVAIDRAANRIVTITAIDNLVKGTAGGAIQSLNIALDLPEIAGLPMNGVAP